MDNCATSQTEALASYTACKDRRDNWEKVALEEKEAAARAKNTVTERAKATELEERRAVTKDVGITAEKDKKLAGQRSLLKIDINSIHDWENISRRLLYNECLQID